MIKTNGAVFFMIFDLSFIFFVNRFFNEIFRPVFEVYPLD